VLIGDRIELSIVNTYIYNRFRPSFLPEPR